MRLEQRSFREGWRYIAWFQVGRGQVVVMERLVTESNGAAAPPKRSKEGAKS